MSVAALDSHLPQSAQQARWQGIAERPSERPPRKLQIAHNIFDGLRAHGTRIHNNACNLHVGSRTRKKEKLSHELLIKQ